MTYPVNLLLTEALYTSKLVARSLETPSGQQISDALRFLNDILGDQSMDSSLIPYIQKYSFTAIPGVNEYFIQNLIDIATFTFFIDTVRYPTRSRSRNNFFGGFRAFNIESLPFTWRFEREKGGGRVYVEFTPDQGYPLEVWGQFGLTSVTQFQELETTYDRYYINYLRYRLAQIICLEYGLAIPTDVDNKIADYEKKIKENISSIDLTVNKVSSFGNSYGVGFSPMLIANNGWIPGTQ